jgi:uroporphyrinogen-III decarboxylase
MSNQTEFAKMTPSEKYNARIDEWKNPADIRFAGPHVKAVYQQRVQMFVDAIELKKPERVPVALNIGFYPCVYASVSFKEGTYDYAKLAYAINKYHKDFRPDTATTAMYCGPGQAYEIVDYKAYNWPGHGVPDTAPFQFLDSDYMKADEFDLLIDDPSNYFIRSYLPRTMGAFGPLAELNPFTDLNEFPLAGPALAQFGLPAVQDAFKKILKAGKAALEWIQAASVIDNETKSSAGLPSFFGGISKAPFDMLVDSLRGTKYGVLDKYRQPRKVMAAVERLTPIMIEMAIRAAKQSQNPLILFPLHKGADNFMSREDFKTYYWPSLKTVILALIREGIIPYLFAEGSYNKRLDLIADPDIPAGKTLWMFDQTDMKEAKKHLSGWACIGGNVSSSLLITAGPQEVKDCVKSLIDEVGQDGGYILSNGAVLNEAKAENLHMLIDFAREYGVYRK